MNRFSRHSRAHDYAMIIASLVAFLLIGAGLIMARIGVDAADHDPSQRIASSRAPLPAITSPAGD